jgi:hypothetical protein
MALGRIDRFGAAPSGWEKGQVENQVGLVRERFFTPRLRFKAFDELNAWLLDSASPTPAAARATLATKQLSDIGFTNVVAVIMNFGEWSKKGNPVVK